MGHRRKPRSTRSLQSLLEQRSITVTADGKQDLEATLAAQAKAEAIQERFREWIWEDPERTRVLAARYNDQFNNLALRQYDGSGRSFEGMSEEWREKVQPHVKNAVERIVNEPTALLAHVVGAGKTAEMVMGTAELKRLGLARKPAVVVPNHMLEQFTREYLEIYPTARISHRRAGHERRGAPHVRRAGRCGRLGRRHHDAGRVRGHPHERASRWSPTSTARWRPCAPSWR